MPELIGSVVISKVANAFFPDAKATGMMRLNSLLTYFLRRLQKGLWVGGNVLLTPSALEFHPNGVNRPIHSGNLDRIIPLSSIASVTLNKGSVTDILKIASRDGSVFLVRCWGASEFGRQIRDVIAAE